MWTNLAYDVSESHDSLIKPKHSSRSDTARSSLKWIGRKRHSKIRFLFRSRSTFKSVFSEVGVRAANRAEVETAAPWPDVARRVQVRPGAARACRARRYFPPSYTWPFATATSLLKRSLRPTSAVPPPRPAPHPLRLPPPSIVRSRNWASRRCRVAWINVHQQMSSRNKHSRLHVIVVSSHFISLPY